MRTFTEADHPRGMAGRFVAKPADETDLDLPAPVTLTDARGLRVAVTPGQLDDEADYLFMNGQCVGMAVALAQSRGWGVVVHSYSDEGLTKHAYAVAEDGTYWDVRGENDPVIVEEDMEPDDELEHYRPDEVRFVIDELEDEGRIGTQDVELARSFVPAVLAWSRHTSTA